MDFFGILFDMKNGKKVPYSKTYFDTLFAAKLGGSDVKTLTGALPLTFTTSETALRSWTIYGADIEHVETATGKSITFYTDEDKLRDWTIYGNAEGVGERTKNFVKANVSQTLAGVTFTVDPAAGTVTANGTATGTAQFVVGINNPDKPNNTTVPPGNYYFSACPSGGSYETFNCYSWDDDTDSRVKQWDGTKNSETDLGQGNCQVQINGHRQTITIRIYRGYTANNVVFKPMLRAANTTPEFIPYGYQVPITVSQTGQQDKNYDIFIGDSQLTEGETVTKSSTGVDIATADGNNTITTSLYNQPDMSITYNEFTGVGILTANLFIIALKLQAGGQTLNVFNTTLNKPLRAGETLTSEQTGQTINTVAGVENKLSPSPKAAAYGGNFEMTIKFKE